MTPTSPCQELVPRTPLVLLKHSTCELFVVIMWEGLLSDDTLEVFYYCWLCIEVGSIFAIKLRELLLEIPKKIAFRSHRYRHPSWSWPKALPRAINTTNYSRNLFSSSAAFVFLKAEKPEESKPQIGIQLRVPRAPKQNSSHVTSAPAPPQKK